MKCFTQQILTGITRYRLKFSSHLFFSRRKYYTLYQRSEENTSYEQCNSNLNSVRQIHLQNGKNLTSCMNSFPNATELHFKDGFSTSCPSVAILLDRIIPLKQLTKLVIECHHFSFKKMIDLLCFTPNICTLIFQSMPFYKDDHLLIEENETFRRVSDTNTITNITFRDECTLEKVQVLVALCPRVQHLSIDTLARMTEPITRFLLDKTNPNTRHLCLLCFPRASTVGWKRLDKLVKSETLLDDYTLRWTRSKLYLWW